MSLMPSEHVFQQGSQTHRPVATPAVVLPTGHQAIHAGTPHNSQWDNSRTAHISFARHPSNHPSIVPRPTHLTR